MPNFTTTLLVLTVLVVLLPSVNAFGAGDIPDFAYLNDKAFRHGDIENILANLAKAVGHGSSGGIVGFAQSVLSGGSGPKFSRSDIKKVYFGNWLRDYSQAMDIAGLSKLSADTLVLVVSVLGFMTFGFATNEFQVTADRLGVYLPTEHIDNPKGYAEKEGDARKFHPKLRGPVNREELEVDERTGMKKYIATEGQSWDTSTALIRRTFQQCIEKGRRAQGKDGEDLWEAYRLLGTGLHTMEDLLAHSNWCELTLRKLGHHEVFCHVGDRVTVNTPNGPAPPLVTGTFGSADFMHSLMGEATDKLSQASVTELTNKMNEQAGQDPNNLASTLKGLLSKLPIGGSSDTMSKGEELQAQSKAYDFNPDNVAPPEVKQQLKAILEWHDSIYRDVLARIEMVPGLGDLLENLTTALNAYVYTILAPWLGPILTQATDVLGEGSKAVIDSDDQYEVFNDDNASDPSHSLLSKDHFGLILNEPAGKIAQLVVEHSVNLIVKAWFDNSDPNQVINEILEAFHHPYYANGRSRIQSAMYEEMGKWIGGLGPELSQRTIQALTKESVREGKNKRLESGGDFGQESGYGTPVPGPYGASGQGGYVGAKKSSYGGAAQGGYGGSNQGGRGEGRQGGYGSSEQSGYGGSTGGGYGGSKQSAYGESTQSSYGASAQSGYGGSTQSGYGGSTQSGYGGSQTGYGGSTQSGYGGSTQSQTEYGSRTETGYGQQESRQSGGYGKPSRKDDDDNDDGGRHKSRKGRNDDDDEYNTGTTRKSQRGHRDPDNDDADYKPEHESRREPARTYGLRDQSSGDRSGQGETRTEYGSGNYGGESRSGYGEGRREHDRDHGQSQGSGYGEESRGYGGDNTSSSYSRNEGGQSGYGERERGHGQESQRGYGGGGGYGSATGGEYASSTGGGYGGSGGNSGYGGASSGGYAPAYIGQESSGYGGGSSETFGAERLNIGDDEEEHHGRKSHKKRNEYDNY